MAHFAHWCAVCPVATVSTLLFYGALLAALFNKRLRVWTLARLAPPPPSTHAYSGALDAYRGFAALLVAFAHMVFFCYPIFWASKDCAPYLISNGGNRAVPVFVMLSGLLIFRSLRKMNGLQDLRDYVRRRFLRIYPLYLVTAVAGVCVGQAGFKISTILSELFMLRTLNFPTYVNPPAWSLYVEVLFYVFLPIFVVATGRRAFWASVVAFWVLVFVDYAGGTREMQMWKYFFAGVIVSYAADWLAARVTRPAAREALGISLFLAGAALMVIDVRGHDWFTDLKLVPNRDGGARTVGLALGFSLVLLGTFSSAVASRAIAVWPLRVLGTISYSIYLIHPFYLLANFPRLAFAKVIAQQPQPFFAAYGVAPWWYGFFVFFPGVLLWSAVSYIVIERPFLMMRPVRPAAGNEPREDKPVSIAHRTAA